MRLGFLTGDNERTGRGDGYSHRAPSEGSPTYCGLRTAGAVRSDGPDWRVPMCPVCWAT